LIAVLYPSTLGLQVWCFYRYWDPTNQDTTAITLSSTAITLSSVSCLYDVLFFFFHPFLRSFSLSQVHEHPEHVSRDDLSAFARRFPAGARAQRSSLGGGLCRNSRCAIGLILFTVFTCVSLGRPLQGSLGTIHKNFYCTQYGKLVLLNVVDHRAVWSYQPRYVLNFHCYISDL